MGTRLGGMRENLSHSGKLGFVLFHLPGFVAFQIAVAMGDMVIDGLKGLTDFAGFHRLVIVYRAICEGFPECEILVIRGVGISDRGRASDFEKFDGAIQEISEVIGEFGIEEHYEALNVEVAIPAGADITTEIVAKRFRAELVGQFGRIDDVSQ